MRAIVCGVVCGLSLGTIHAGVVGVVTDGEGDWHFEERTELFQRELADLMEDSEPPEFRVVHGGWTSEGIQQALKTTLADAEVDVVYTAGAVASMIARALPEGERTKPVLGGAVIYSQSDEYPITEDGTSPIPNFTYISSPARVADDLALTVRLRKTDTVYVLIDALMLAHLPHRKENQERFEERVGVKLEFVEGKATAASYLDQLPDGVTSVYLSLLGRLGPEERKALFIGLLPIGATVIGAKDASLLRFDVGIYDIRIGPRNVDCYFPHFFRQSVH